MRRLCCRRAEPELPARTLEVEVRYGESGSGNEEPGREVERGRRRDAGRAWT